MREFDPIIKDKRLECIIRAQVLWRRKPAGVLTCTPEGFSYEGDARLKEFFEKVKREGFVVFDHQPHPNGGCILIGKNYPLNSYTYLDFMSALPPSISLKFLEVKKV